MVQRSVRNGRVPVSRNSQVKDDRTSDERGYDLRSCSHFSVFSHLEVQVGKTFRYYFHSFNFNVGSLGYKSSFTDSRGQRGTVARFEMDGAVGWCILSVFNAAGLEGQNALFLAHFKCFETRGNEEYEKGDLYRDTTLSTSLAFRKHARRRRCRLGGSATSDLTDRIPLGQRKMTQWRKC